MYIHIRHFFKAHFPHQEHSPVHFKTQEHDFQPASLNKVKILETRIFSASTSPVLSLCVIISLAHKLNFAGHVIVTTGLRRMHFPRPGFFLRWNSNLQQVDFSKSFGPDNILGLAVFAVNDGFLHLHTCVISPFFCLHFCHLEIQI